MKPYKIYSDSIDQKALDQFHSAMKQDFVVRGALMPDAHAGYALPIGAVVATDSVVVPAWVGYDIGCGMCAIETTFHPGDINDAAKEIFNRIYDVVPVGFNHNKKETNWDYSDIPRTATMDEIFSKNGLLQLGSLGGGNHFIEIGYGVDSSVWVIVHSGSRGIGHAVATHYMKLASGSTRAREGHFGLDVATREGRDYINDLNFCLEFALKNREEILHRVVSVISEFCQGSVVKKSFINRNHNHAELKDGMWIHRKGATQAEDGMRGVIPGNMRDGSFIVCGKGNPESLWSSSHGAGRVLSRKQAKESLCLDAFVRKMEGVTAKIDQSTLDESPAAYKNIFEVMKDQQDLVQVVGHILPMINIKG